MKILYSVQATGNGHIARAIELMPYLKTYGEVDVLLSGSNSNLQFELPVKYRSKGLSFFYGNRGGLDYWKTLKTFEPLRVWREAKALPVEQYDVVLNDFESITALACKLKNVPSVNFGHQASFQSKHSPRPAHTDPVGEFVLQHYAAATSYVGLHFNSYDNFIYNPVIKDDILKATPTNKGHITVYLSHYADEVLAASLQQIKEVRFEVFSKQVQSPVTKGNIRFVPISNKGFTESMISSLGVITGAGFETPAEVLYLGKKLLCLPIKGQYEQWCNAAALEHFNVPIVPTINELFVEKIRSWLCSNNPLPLKISHSTYEIVQHVMETARALTKSSQPTNKNIPSVEKDIFVVE